MAVSHHVNRGHRHLPGPWQLLGGPVRAVQSNSRIGKSRAFISRPKTSIDRVRAFPEICFGHSWTSLSPVLPVPQWGILPASREAAVGSSTGGMREVIKSQRPGGTGSQEAAPAFPQLESHQPDTGPGTRPATSQGVPRVIRTCTPCRARPADRSWSNFIIPACPERGITDVFNQAALGRQGADGRREESEVPWVTQG